MIGEESRFNYSIRLRTVDEQGNQEENERVHIPYPREPIVTVLRPDLQEYTVRSGDEWSNMGARFIRGRSDLWWVLAEFTGVIDPFSELTVGKKVKVPQFDTVMFEVLNFEAKAGGNGTRDLDESL